MKVMPHAFQQRTLLDAGKEVRVQRSFPTLTVSATMNADLRCHVVQFEVHQHGGGLHATADSLRPRLAEPQ